MNPRPLRELLHRAVARYLKVSPAGLHLQGAAPARSAAARVVAWSPARTLYRERRPHCRSLDAAVSVTHVGRRCDACAFKSECTTQIRLDLLIAGRPYRVMLAYTSARNFLLFEADVGVRGLALDAVDIRLDVLDRGTFGEIAFSVAG